jgi:alginate O-acetyltransferase complex protein AlgI
MVFTSWTFVAFFTSVLILLGFARSRSSRQFLILVSSIIFYGNWNKWYLLPLAAPSVIDFICASRIAASESRKQKRVWLIVSLVSNLSLLGYFKYCNFFLENVGRLLGHNMPALDMVLPVGISFYTFKTLSYTIDVYRGEIEACRSWWKYAMFVTYFPELIAGPIVRASVFLPQMTRSLKPSLKRSEVGMQLVLLGTTKKLLISDRLAPFVELVFKTPAAFSPFTVFSAVIAYSLQIYCDFSGYSDIAIGVSRIIGFDLPENFNMPYAATSVTEFWRRWHMTLSSWLRDYLYIPLGGNRKGRVRTHVNLIITMLLGGLWHGANWTFIAWGLLHGFALVIHKVWSEHNKKWRIRIPMFAAWVFTYAFICVAWVFFRSPDFATAKLILSKMLGLTTGGVQYTYLPLFLVIPFVVFAHCLGTAAAHVSKLQPGRRTPPPSILRWVYSGANNTFALKPHSASGTYVLLPLPGFWGGMVITCWVVVLYLFSALHPSPFIYFQF